VSEVVTGILLLTASAFLLLAGVAVLRLPDLFMRLSASSKAVSLGAGVLFAAVAVYFGETGVVTRSIAGMAFFLLTSPVAAHVMARAGSHIGIPFWRNTVNAPPSRATTPDQDGPPPA
jgi:multicomponent Na+:H+ antiporter subunit G